MSFQKLDICTEQLQYMAQENLDWQTGLELKNKGFQDEEINKILGNNWFNFYKGIN